jgi:putative holliday junction resolvase
MLLTGLFGRDYLNPREMFSARISATRKASEDRRLRIEDRVLRYRNRDLRFIGDLPSSIFDLRFAAFDTVRGCFLYFPSMRVLAIDLGTKNIGTAISDALGMTVRPVETIRRSSNERVIARLKFLVEDLDAEAVVVGLPLRMDGTAGDAAAAAMRFVEKLSAQLDVGVFTQDERLTSYEAEQMMIERGFTKSKRRARSDEFAAMIILQDYLSASKPAN